MPKESLLPVLFTSKARKVKKRKKVWVAETFSKQWPKILNDIVEYPDRKMRDHWNKWSERLLNVPSYNDFARLLKKNKMTPREVKKAVSVESQALVAVQTFASSKKIYAERHMERIHKKMEAIHDVVDGLKVNPKSVNFVLDLVSRLHKEGRIAYSIDEETDPNKKAVNLAVLIGYDPVEKVAKAVEVPSP